METKRITIIEDNPDVGSYVAMLIENAGLGKATVIMDGLEGLAACFRHPPDAVVLDIELPGLRGEEVLRLLRTSKEHRFLPIIVCSSLPAAKRREFDLLRMGADVYMDKPLPEAAFLRALRDLTQSGPRRNAESSTEDKTSTTSKRFIDKALAKELDEGSESPNAVRSPGSVSKSPVPPIASSVEPDRPPSSFAADLSFSKTEVNADGKDTNPSTRHVTPPERVHETTYDGYRILGVVGSGGMGTVYRAEQLKLGRNVALKVLLENFHANPVMRERFHREAIIMAQVSHPNIVQVFEAGQTEFSSYFSMEFVDGDSLETRIRDNSLNWEECPSLIRQACNAVAHLHSLGIVHRDIKPSNLLVSRRGLVKVTDFGISQARLPAEGERFTDALLFMGTPDYMAPELKRLQEANERTDVFALGMTFWRMFAGPDALPLGKPLARLHPEIPEALSAAIARCIASDPEDRFGSVLEARDAILEACKGTFSGTWEQYVFSPI